jgi:ElaB/YqjD/DUF883 family membrane-anchored ribosome-binding protein
MANEPSSSNFSSGSPSNFNDKLSAAANETKARAADLGRKATDTADQARTTAAAGLGAAAGAIADNADKGANRARRAAHRTADALSSGADYIRDTSVRDMMDDATEMVKNNPGAALLGAVAIGFLVGRAFSSRN